MPKATQVQAPKKESTVPKCFRGGNCRHCGETIRDYNGFHIGDLVYCDFGHYLKYRKKDDV